MREEKEWRPTTWPKAGPVSSSWSRIATMIAGSKSNATVKRATTSCQRAGNSAPPTRFLLYTGKQHATPMLVIHASLSAVFFFFQTSHHCPDPAGGFWWLLDCPPPDASAVDEFGITRLGAIGITACPVAGQCPWRVARRTSLVIEEKHEALEANLVPFALHYVGTWCYASVEISLRSIIRQCFLGYTNATNINHYMSRCLWRFTRSGVPVIKETDETLEGNLVLFALHYVEIRWHTSVWIIVYSVIRQNFSD